MGHQSEGKESQQRTVGIGAQDIDGIDDTRRVEGSEAYDEEHEDQCHGEMHLFAEIFILIAPEDIHAYTGGKGGKSRVGTRETGCHHSYREEHGHHRSQGTRGSKHRQQVVGLFGKGHALRLGQHHQQHTEGEEEQIGWHEGETIAAHVFLGFTQCLAGQVFLHHVLVETSHHDDHEDTAEKLFPEVLSRHPVVEDKDARVFILADSCDGLRGCHSELSCHLIYNKDKRGKHAECLKGVGPYQCLDASLACIEPDEHHHRWHGEPEGNTDVVEHEVLQDEAHHEEAHGCSCHLRQQKEGSSRLVGTVAQPVEQIGIDGGEVVPIIYRQQDESHQEVTDDEA